MKSILSIDGGGIRGIVPAYILAHIEARLKTENDHKNSYLVNYFDLISGTSTGGILTCLYIIPSDKTENCVSIPKFSAADALSLYEELGPVLFRRSFLQILRSCFGLFCSRYSEDALYTFSKKLMGDTYLSEVLKDCLITSYEMSTRKALLFSKRSAINHGNCGDYKMADIARSTSAAPTYFPPALIFARDKTSRHLVDGGVYANNPTMCSLVEAAKLWPSATTKDLMILSMGTGKVEMPYTYEKTRCYGFANWIIPIIDILMSSTSETVDYQVEQLFDIAQNRSNYIRIEPSILGCDTKMDNASAKNIKSLKCAAQGYIDHNQDVIDRIIGSLIIRNNN